MKGQYWSRWRLAAAPIIARVLAEMKGKPEKEIREALRLAYPFGEKAMYPYKIWLDEIRRQMTGEKTSLTRYRDRRKRSANQVYNAEHRLREWEAIYGRRNE